MKKVFVKKENWLLIIPFLIWLLEKIITGPSGFDFHLHGTYFVINNTYLGFIFLMLAVLPFISHWLLCKKQKGNKRILLWHIILTSIAVIVLFIFIRVIQTAYTGLAGPPRRYYDYSAWTGYLSFMSTHQKVIVISVLLYVLLQLWLFVYTIVNLVRQQ
jgi:hypothetical protein